MTILKIHISDADSKNKRFWQSTGKKILYKDKEKGGGAKEEMQINSSAMESSQNEKNLKVNRNDILENEILNSVKESYNMTMENGTIRDVITKYQNENISLKKKVEILLIKNKELKKELGFNNELSDLNQM